MSIKKEKLISSCFIIVIFIILFITINFTNTNHNLQNTNKVTPLNNGWYYINNNNEKVYIELPTEIIINDDSDLTIYNDNLTSANSRATILTKAAYYRAKIVFGNQIIYQYNDTHFKRNDPMRTKLDCTAQLPENINNQTLSITYENQKSSHFYLNPIYIGKSAAVFRHQCYSQMLNITLIFIMGIIGLLFGIVYLYLNKLYTKDIRIRDLSLFLLLCALWSLLDSPLMQTISNDSPILCIISFYCYMSMVSPMVDFVRQIKVMKKYDSLYLIIILLNLNIIVQSLLNVFAGVEFVNMLFITHILQATACIHCTRLILKEYRISKDPELKIIFNVLFILVFATSIDLILYWLIKLPDYGLLFKISILISICYLLYNIVYQMVDSVRVRTEAEIYKKLSFQDRLTGLLNRQSYEDKLNNINKLNKIDDLVLVYLDVNNLKYINDNYGHNAGDEIIIAAAHVIEQTFGMYGTCYRIGGDEFAVISDNLKDDIQIIIDNLNQNIDSYNVNKKYKLSIAKGYSYIKDSSNNIKRLSDWKFEADQNMYRDKKEQKKLSNNNRKEELL